MTVIGDEATVARRAAAYLERELSHPVEIGTVRRFTVGFPG